MVKIVLHQKIGSIWPVKTKQMSNVFGAESNKLPKLRLGVDFIKVKS